MSIKVYVRDTDELTRVEGIVRYTLDSDIDYRLAAVEGIRVDGVRVSAKEKVEYFYPPSSIIKFVIEREDEEDNSFTE